MWLIPPLPVRNPGMKVPEILFLGKLPVCLLFLDSNKAMERFRERNCLIESLEYQNPGRG
jgi:hypothetical protein